MGEMKRHVHGQSQKRGWPVKVVMARLSTAIHSVIDHVLSFTASKFR